MILVRSSTYIQKYICINKYETSKYMYMYIQTPTPNTHTHIYIFISHNLWIEATKILKKYDGQSTCMYI